jgi:putative iron-dependent peroxidase
MSTSQPAILSPVPAHARYLQFNARAGADTKAVLSDLAAHPLGENVVIGFGPGLMQGLGVSVEGLRPFPALSGRGLEIPSTQSDIWVWVGGGDRGDIAKIGNMLTHLLAPLSFEQV